jgi:hypothetical protein
MTLETKRLATVAEDRIVRDVVMLAMAAGGTAVVCRLGWVLRHVSRAVLIDARSLTAAAVRSGMP